MITEEKVRNLKIKIFLQELPDGRHELFYDNFIDKEEGRYYLGQTESDGSIICLTTNFDSIVESLDQMIPEKTYLVWPEILRRLEQDEEVGFFGDDCPAKVCYVGSELHFAPSGKIYAPWTTNQTEFDVLADEIFWELLEDECQQNGTNLHIDSGDVFVVKYL